MKKILALLLAMLLCLSFFVGCGEDSEESTGGTLDTNIVATIDGYEISQADYNCHYFVYYSQYAQYSYMYGENWLDQDMGEGKTIGEVIKANTKEEIEQFVTATVMAKEQFGITEADVKDKVDENMEELITSYGSEEAFNNFLIEAHTTKTALRRYFERYEIYTLLAEKRSVEGGDCYVSDEEVVTEFELEYGSKMKVQHILISTTGDGVTTPARTDEEALAIANEVIGKLNNGADFGSLMGEYSEDGLTSENYYVFGDGEMVPEFEEASKNLTIGEYTKEPVKSEFGYHIIKKYPLDNTSDEYKELRTYLAQDKLFLIIEEEAKNRNFNWDDNAINTYIENWIAEMATTNSSQTTVQ